jgi:hypothetical protein
MGFNPDSKAEQRRELERLMANYDGPIIRSKADQQLQVVARSWRLRIRAEPSINSGRPKRLATVTQPMRPWWVR